MAINIGKGSAAGPAASDAGDALEGFRALIARRVDPDYCTAAEREALIREGVNLGLSRTDAEGAFDLELESGFTANEHALLAKLDANLRQFTDKDKKLDDKERRDAVQLACRPSIGYRQGLRFDVAERYLVQFCRTNGVKVKTGFMRWAVP